MFFGGRSDDRDDNVNPLALIGMVILAPLAAAIIQMSISRTREYLAMRVGYVKQKTIRTCICIGQNRRIF